ncbi:SDR family NAD(P)-dependent oxidoreductase [Neolewinella aurantiaca]|uniref:SDR family NAD(P)-dependent oxidoreductase n=1 Tax=Neolewinella aurantiaca TaxID=2602767 RepID=A0A5C7FTM4_9BACT|nr:oxidoreductase [Neolewinella aurantiaca]TXF88176.1 SDR family NAD(P)-dependent oxidoreductase [Neolewinella aurantiaca]
MSDFKSNPSETVWFITGASSGFGEEQAKLLLEKGYKVVATSRNVDDVKHFEKDYPETALSLPLDVLEEDQIVSAVKQATDKFGRIDVLHNNAGYGTFGALEEFSTKEIMAQFNVNIFGLIRLTQEVLPIMREQQSGTILNMSSVAGRISFPAFGLYSSTKHALEGLSKGLAQEVAPFGIKVILVEPGVFRTDFGGRSLAEAKNKIEAYKPIREKVMENLGGQYEEFDDEQGDPAKAAKAMLKITEVENPPLFLALGLDAYDNIDKQMQRERKQLETWEELTKATAYQSNVEILKEDLTTV